MTIEGVRSLSGTEHTILPDMIEVGSFIGMAAMTGSEITIKNTGYDKLGIIPDAFRRLGITVEQRGDDIYIPRHDSYEIDTFIDGSIMTIADAPWPGLTPDLLSVFLVVATQSVGSVLIHQKMFESRLFFVDKLIDMGAQIILCDPHRATVIGLGNRFKLRGSTMVSPDIRAGIALLIAAMSAEGTSTIHNIDQIDGILVPFFVEDFRYKTDTVVLVKLEDVNSEEDARMFVGKEVFYPLDAVDEEDLVGDMTWDSFIGYTVTDVQKGYLGEITDVDETTINVLLRVDHKGEELLIPAVEELITEADHEARSLTVSLPEGLIELIIDN